MNHYGTIVVDNDYHLQLSNKKFKKMDEKSISGFKDFVKNKNLKFTSQRELILTALLKSKNHVSAEELYDMIRKTEPVIGQATVYRTLKILVEANLVNRLDFGDGMYRYEPNMEKKHHDHMVCKRCGKKIEFIDENIEVLQKKLATKYNFQLTGHRLYLFGYCQECQKK